MKIIHTADWHIGKKLHKYDLQEDFNKFVEWFIDFIRNNDIDIVLVSGDIFDSSNPSAEARKQFYETLLAIHKLNCKLFITAGNHDSPSVLNAPKELLQQLDINVIGNLPDDISKCIFPIKNKLGLTEVIIIAIPFLRDSELRKVSEIVSYEEKLTSIQNSIERIFTEAQQHCKNYFPNIPTIAMGHLFTAGDIIQSESERDIQVGNQALFDAERFGNQFSYVALGHIHKPQKVKASIPIYYSGSPISLSFSERDDKKRLLLLDINNGFEPENIPIPTFRNLTSIQGDLATLHLKLNKLPTITDLKGLLEINLKENKYSAQIEEDFIGLINNFSNPSYEIVKTKMEFADRVQITELFEPHERLSDLEPKEVFLKLLQTQPYDQEIQQELLFAFQSLLDEVN